MRVFLCLMLAAILTLSIYGTEVKNSGKPRKGNWDFKPKQLWMLSEAGQDVFAVIDSIRVSADGAIYVMDSKNYKVYVVSKEGKFLYPIGNKGSGPGEFLTLRDLALVGDNLIVVDDMKIHYFTKEGKYLKSVINQYLNLSPADFLTPDKFISVTFFTGSISEKGQILIYDVIKKEKKLIWEFPKFNEGAISIKTGKDTTTTFSFSVSYLTPKMILGIKKDKLYFGMNNEYKIKITDLNGKEISTFSLDRKRERVSTRFKEEIVSRLAPPSDIKKEVFKRIPDYLNYFDYIYVDDNGFIYVFIPSCENFNIQKIDIFSNTGKYLYSAQLKLEPGYVIRNLHIAGKSMYLAIETGDGEIFLAKYDVVKPG